MLDKIIKRDGRIVPFSEEKIARAIYKAAQSVGGENYDEAERLSKMAVAEIFKKCQGQVPDIEIIQDVVEKTLIEDGHAKTAKAYILYRAERSRVREKDTRLMTVFSDIVYADSRESDLKRENANVNGDTAMGMMLKFGSESSKTYALNFMVNPEHAKMHKAGDIHIHDLDFLPIGTTTCCQLDLDKLFTGGFNTGHGNIREPKDIRSFTALACIAVQANQNEQHGGQSIPNFDRFLAKGVMWTYKKTFIKHLTYEIEDLAEAKGREMKVEAMVKEVLEEIEKTTGHYPRLEDDKIEAMSKAIIVGITSRIDICDGAEIATILRRTIKRATDETEKATFQAMEAAIHNFNTLNSRAGSQVPFSSINYGTDTTPEGRMVIRNVLYATDKGLGGGETPIFPVQIFRVKKGINYNEGDPNYDLFKLACKVSAKRLYPNFAFQDAPFNLQYYKEGQYNTEIAYMGCRTRVMGNVYDKSREISYSRGNLSFTSINLPRLGMLAKGNMQTFYKLLNEKMNIVFDQLAERMEIQGRKKILNFPFLMGQGMWLDADKLSMEETIAEVIKHGSLSVGFIGLAECLTALIGKHHGQSDEAKKLGLEIIHHMRKRCDDKAAATNLNYTLLATPAEGLSGRFTKIDKENFGIIDGITDKEFYTNSFHVPVDFNISMFDKIRTEAPYHELTNAGHISYVEFDGNPLDNLPAFEKVVKYMCESGMGYGAINHAVDRDCVCGYNGIIGSKCPGCGRAEEDGPDFDRIRRITGYLVGTMDRWNDSKRAEEASRVKHNM